METNVRRIKKHIEKLAQFNSTPNEGITRLTYSNEDRNARDYLINYMKELGLKVRVDPIGNIRARLKGKDPNAPIIMTGSHIDTVLHGGKFDGVVGVVGGLEVINVLIENDIRPYNPIELVVFVEEEGGNFKSLVGSKMMTKDYEVDDLKEFKNNQGISIYEVAKTFGLNPNQMSEYTLKTDEVKAMFEMHVEQSVVLDSEEIPVGIVQAVAGRKWIEVELEGVANHAGATPMHYRQDPMVGAAKVITAVENIVKAEALSSTVATVGKINCEPNEPNVIPKKVNFVVDLRDVDPKGIEITVKRLNEEVEKIAKEDGLSYKVRLMSETVAVKLSDQITDIIETVAKKKKIPYKKMNSGALHDACVLAGVTDVGMIFVPSINGRSHTPEEATEFSDIKIGCDLLLGSILELVDKA